MNLKNKLKATAVAVLLLGTSAFGGAAMAQQTTPPAQQGQTQQNFTDAELQQFADASARLMAVQQEGEKKMMGILQEENLSIDKFNEMAQAHQQQQLDQVEATTEEKAAFNKAAQRMIEMQPEMQKNVEAAIQKDGMSLDKYEQIMIAYRQNEALQQRVNEMMMQDQK
ncbi:DUF4168 domain-containing protein [Pontibacter actiniarum]|uniref:DUF4168 domain-containing protein n=1 Tax=Pontibacter actiniarum TaxID=323450 RepID=A0A1X9YW75_9BACT|nr:DUF4168 domain-containing protein [Pontibacter actiniarum]ARS37177.1 hypothetical protein CA264_18045 [Pontibacter actiniarum]